MLEYNVPKFAAAAPDKPRTSRRAGNAPGAWLSNHSKLGFQEMQIIDSMNILFRKQLTSSIPLHEILPSVGALELCCQHTPPWPSSPRIFFP